MKWVPSSLKLEEIVKKFNEEKEGAFGYTDILDKKRIYKKKIKGR